MLREGTRAAVPHTNPALVPTGTYDGMYVQDWVYDPDRKRARIEAALAKDGAYLGLSRAEIEQGRAEYRVLDETNGFVTDGIALSEYDHAVYAYVLTEDWPEVPRMLRFQPSDSFRQVVPYQAPQGGRVKLYDACTGSLEGVHTWDGRARY